MAGHGLLLGWAMREKENPLFETAQVIEQEQGTTLVSPGFMAQEVANSCKGRFEYTLYDRFCQVSQTGFWTSGRAPRGSRCTPYIPSTALVAEEGCHGVDDNECVYR
jgi:hypothetical protein